MSVSEQDLELLETWLDGALEPAEASAVAARVAGEPALGLMVEELRQQRSLRAVVWQSMEPDQLSADRVAWQIRGAMADRSVPRSAGFSPFRLARWGSVAAACVVLGFVAGRSGQPVVMPTAVDSKQPAMQVAAAPDHTGQQPIVVPVTNEYGQVVAWQKFQNSDDARNFTEDLNRAHGNAQTPANPNIKLVDEQQY